MAGTNGVMGRTVAVPIDMSEAMMPGDPAEAAPAQEEAVEEEVSPVGQIAESEQTEQVAEEIPAEAEEAPAEEAPAAPGIDLRKTVEDLTPVAQWAQETSQLMNGDESFKMAYLQALHRKGQLPQEYHHLIAPQEAAPVQQSAPAKVTHEQAKAEYKKLMSMGREDEAADYWLEYRQSPKISAIEQKLAAEEKRRADEQTKWTQNMQAQERSKLEQKALGEVAQLSKAYPDLVAMDAQGRPQFKNKEFHKRLIEASRGISPFEPLEKIAKYVLSDMGKLAAASKPQPKPAAIRPRIQATAAPGGKIDKPRTGEVAVRVNIEGR